MKTICNAYLERGEMLAARDALIKELTEKKTLVKYSDTAVESKTTLFIFKTIPFNFDLSQIQGYERVECDGIIAYVQKVLDTMLAVSGKSVAGAKPTGTETPSDNQKPE